VLVDAAEAWGLHEIWLGEIHFNGNRSVQSAPLALSAFIAARTRRIRVGTAVQVLPLSNPLHLAEQVATVDQLSQGRFDFGIAGAARRAPMTSWGFLMARARRGSSKPSRSCARRGKERRSPTRASSTSSRTRPSRPCRTSFPIRPCAWLELRGDVPARGAARASHLRGAARPRHSLARDPPRCLPQGLEGDGHAGNPDAFLRIPVYLAATETEASRSRRRT